MTAYKTPRIFSQTGFTLVEMMIALVIAALAMTAILVANMGQSQSYNTQLQVANARQKARAAIAMLRADLLMTDRFIVAGPTGIQLRRADGITVTYAWSPDDNNNNGSGPELLRQEGAAAQETFAEGIDGIEFFYHFARQPPTNNPDPAQLRDITAVTISLVSRADGVDPHFQDRDTYRNRTASGQNWAQDRVAADRNLNNATPLNDNFHRRFWQETVACRNMVP